MYYRALQAYNKEVVPEKGSTEQSGVLFVDTPRVASTRQRYAGRVSDSSDWFLHEAVLGLCQ